MFFVLSGYLSVTSTSPAFTDAPFTAVILSTVPAPDAIISFSIFMASRMTRTSPLFTGWPSCNFDVQDCSRHRCCYCAGAGCGRGCRGRRCRCRCGCCGGSCRGCCDWCRSRGCRGCRCNCSCLGHFNCICNSINSDVILFHFNQFLSQNICLFICLSAIDARLCCILPVLSAAHAFFACDVHPRSHIS